ncbi:hypothetical protein [Burkholderia sp. MSMB1078WGS]|uniref:hypothetical protein n=1 Tax=Burkholderia sp. MSMB1078WGS TaxID=1637900 RepID=UPI000A687863|nr:hypothetical protein [Burkholderia sp. MSMB1078WGS]
MNKPRHSCSKCLRAGASKGAKFPRELLPREVTIRLYADLGNVPCAGKRRRVVLDARDPARVTYLGQADPGAH